MLEAAILDEVTAPRFNPPALVEQMRMLPYARITEELVQGIEKDYERAREQREASMAGLASMMSDETFKDDGDGFSSIIDSFEANATSVGQKLHVLEKELERAQSNDALRDRLLDDRLLSIAREDFEDRIDVAVFWRALQAKIWSTPTSADFKSGEDLAAALRSAVG